MTRYSFMTRLKRRKVGRPGTGKRAAPAAEFAKAGGPLLATPTREGIRKILTENRAPMDIIVQMARGSKETIRILGELASDPHGTVRDRAAMAILGLADACGDVPGLLSNLVIAALDKEAEPGAAHSLGPILLLGLPILGMELTRGETEARIAAARAIGVAASCGHNMVLLTPALTGGISDADARVQKESIAALGKMEAAGQEIKFSVPFLLLASTMDESPIRAGAIELVRRPGISGKLSRILCESSEIFMEHLDDHQSRIQAATVISAVMRSEPFLEGVGRQDSGYLDARTALGGVLAEIERLEEADATPKS